MNRMTGTPKHNLDQTNRLAIPAKIRADLGDSFVLTVSPSGEKCLLAYTFDGWDRVMARINDAPSSEELMLTQRFIYMNSDKIELDSQGRMTIPAQFMEAADFHKEVHILGVGERVEFWDPVQYAAMLERSRAAMQNKKLFFSL